MRTITSPPELATWIRGVVIVRGRVVECVTEVAIPDTWGDTQAVLDLQAQCDALTMRAGTLLRHSTQRHYGAESQERIRGAALGVARYAQDITEALVVLHADWMDAQAATAAPHEVPC